MAQAPFDRNVIRLGSDPRRRRAASADPQHGLRNTMFHQCLTTTDFPGTHGTYMAPCTSGNPLQYRHHHRGSNLEVHTQRCNTTDSQRWRTR